MPPNATHSTTCPESGRVGDGSHLLTSRLQVRVLPGVPQTPSSAATWCGRLSNRVVRAAQQSRAKRDHLPGRQPTGWMDLKRDAPMVELRLGSPPDRPSWGHHACPRPRQAPAPRHGLPGRRRLRGVTTPPAPLRPHHHRSERDHGRGVPGLCRRGRAEGLGGRAGPARPNQTAGPASRLRLPLSWPCGPFGHPASPRSSSTIVARPSTTMMAATM
jgi:hypothetical protein